jgi:uncharacterized membrane protein
MGPRLFLVPLLIGPLYFGVGYLSWTLARAMLGDANGRLAGRLAYATPIVASFIMVCWDLTIDPKMSTITSNWIWRDGGSYFGVPVEKFLGWYLTVYVFLQVFALYARRLSATPDRIPGYDELHDYRIEYRIQPRIRLEVGKDLGARCHLGKEFPRKLRSHALRALRYSE